MEYINFFIDFVLHLDVHLAELTAQYGIWVYAILFVIIFCETGLVVTPFLPGDSLLFASGALASMSENSLSIHIMVLLLIVAAILGDAVNYTIGQLFGTKLFSNPNSKIFKKKYLDQTHAFYEKHGGKTIILARFVPIVRTFAPFVAGMGRMTYRRFASYNVIGGVLWVTIFSYLGYFFGGLDFVRNNMGILVIVIIVISLLPAIFEVWRNRRKNQKIKKTHEKT
ncbi:MAG: DedA family protein [Prevotellaceae bacterium]|jgi:membrane-associated protein|nr:DedA family protein [Prevotellaceae bacterium]